MINVRITYLMKVFPLRSTLNNWFEVALQCNNGIKRVKYDSHLIISLDCHDSHIHLQSKQKLKNRAVLRPMCVIRWILFSLEVKIQINTCGVSVLRKFNKQIVDIYFRFDFVTIGVESQYVNKRVPSSPYWTSFFSIGR